MKPETEFEVELKALFKKYEAEVWPESGSDNEPYMTLYFVNDDKAVEIPIDYINENGFCEY